MTSACTGCVGCRYERRYRYAAYRALHGQMALLEAQYRAAQKRLAWDKEEFGGKIFKEIQASCGEADGALDRKKEALISELTDRF